MIGNNPNFSGTAGQLIIGTIEDELFIKGESFSTRDVYASPAATNLYFHFDPTGSSGKQIVLQPLGIVAAEAGPVRVNFYAAPTLLAGGRTPVLVNNRRSTSSVVSESVVEMVALANISNNGTRFQSVIVPSSSASGNQASFGAAGLAGQPFELNPAIDYLIEIDNENGVDALVEVSASWVEASI